MIIIKQTVGNDLTDLIIDENMFKTETGATDILFASFEYDGNDWQYNSSVVTLSDYGISFTGTPVATDTISVAYNPQTLYVFSAGKGINAVKINYNFAELQQDTNTNETLINTIDAQALKKDGSNLSQSIVDDFNTVTPIVLTNQSSTISLQDNKSYYISLSGNASVSLPTIVNDNISHTITAVVVPNSWSFNLSATHGTLGSLLYVNAVLPYQVMFIYNKIDGYWYYSLGQ